MGEHIPHRQANSVIQITHARPPNRKIGNPSPTRLDRIPRAQRPTKTVSSSLHPNGREMV
jgi:hypothetical protein